MITPRTIVQKLRGRGFEIRDECSATVTFTFPDSYENLHWPRQGMEGIVTPVTCHHPTAGDLPSILKCFFDEIPERSERIRHLLSFGLASTHDWLYEGVPYTLVNQDVDGQRVYGHITRHVCYDRHGENFKIVRDGSIDDYSEDNRRELAAQLCCSIVGLERLGLTHSDLSPRNIVVGRDGVGDVRCIVIDYDAFHCAAVPKLPRKYNGRDARPIGTPGYQHPSLMRRIASDAGSDDSIYVPNDRFALGVLCFELMVWSTQLSAKLDTDLIMDEQELAKGRLTIPNAVRGIWPEGLKLLEHMVREPDINSLPTPEDWLKALGFLGHTFGGLQAKWATRPVVKISRQVGNLTPQPLTSGGFGKAKGDLGGADHALSAVKYRCTARDGICNGLFVSFDWQVPVILKRAGVTTSLDPRNGEVEIGPGDKLLSNGWVFEFQDA